jgi:acyl-CoA synthetase (AMP-forming)/AMP-acid ligase II
MNIAMLLEMAADAFGDRVAVGDRTGGLTYSQLFAQSGEFATTLVAGDAKRLIWTDVTSELLPIALFGSAWAGKPFVPLNYRLADDRLAALIAKQSPALVLCAPDTVARHGVTDGISVVPTQTFVQTLMQGRTSTNVGDAIVTPERDDGPDGIAVLLHTSGTSGDPKIAVLRHKHLTAYVLGSVEFMSADEDEATLVSVPPYHIAGIAAILTSTFAGRRIVQMASFEPNEWVRLVREQAVTTAMVVPTMLARILEVLEDGHGLPSLRHLSYGGGRMPIPVIEKAIEMLPHVNFVNAYGLTETSSSIAILGPDDHREAMASAIPAVRARLGSVGQPLPMVEISIRDLNGNEVPIGASGEVWVRGEQVSGEYSNSAVTMIDGWFATKDGGHLDDEGFLFVEGRMDDVIVRGGENLSPGEIEDVLLSHHAVADAVVIGIPDDEWGEAVAAFVVARDGYTLTEGEMQAWVVTHLRSSRQPKVVEFRTELPYNDMGKVLRRVLRDEMIANN